MYHLVRKENFVATGRPREFDTEKALDAALKVFWRKGYEGASLPDLTAAMGINRPSLYAAFGNKEALFRAAIDRYVDFSAAHLAEALLEPTSRGVVEKLWNDSIDLVTNARNPKGCFLVQAALACGEEAEGIRREVSKRRGLMESLLRKRFEQALAERDLPASADPAVLAKFVATISHGMAVQAVSGATRAELKAVAEFALRAWPG